MINIPWHGKIEAQQLFYFVILPVGGTLIDLVVSMKRTRRVDGDHFLHQTAGVTASLKHDQENQE